MLLFAVDRIELIYMQVLSEKIINIEAKVRQLALKMERLQEENAVLTEENRKLTNELAARDQRVGELNSKLALSQSKEQHGGEQHSGSTKKLRKEIDQYIKEIDKCIDWLQNA